MLCTCVNIAEILRPLCIEMSILIRSLGDFMLFLLELRDVNSSRIYKI